MYDLRNPLDDEDERDRLYRELMGMNGQDVVQLPEVSITADADQVAPPYDKTPPEPIANDNAEPDTRMAELMKAREQTAASEPSAPSSDSGGDGSILQDWDTLAALVLDAAANKGRGLGQIVGAYASNKEKTAQQKQQAEQHMAEIKARKEMDPFAQLLALEKLGEVKRGHDLQQSGQEGTQARFEHTADQKEDPNSASYKAKYENAVKLAGGTTHARSQAKAEDAEQDAETAGTIASARSEASTKGRNKGNAEAPPPITPEQKANNERADKQFAATEELRKETQRTAQSQNLNRLAPIYKALAAGRELAPILKKYEGAKDTPGIGVWDAWVSESLPHALGGPTDEGKRIRQLVSSLQGPEVKALYGASLTPGEKEFAGRQFGALGGGDEQATKIAIGEILKGLEARGRSGLVGNELAAPDFLKAYGLGDLMPQAAVAAPAAPAPVSAELGTVSGKGKLGKMSAPATGKPDEYDMRSPSGQTGKLTLTPPELDRLLKQGWEVM